MRRYLVALTALAAGLCGAIAFEVTGRVTAAQNPVTPGAVMPPPARVDAISDQTLAAAILARPLFAPSRRPAATGKPASDNLPRVSGIIISPAGDAVVFMPANGHPIVVGQGGRVGAYTLTAISMNSITIAGPKGLRELHTAFAVGTGTDQSFAASTPATIPDWMRDLTPGTTDLPNAARWDGPPRISALPIRTSNAASAPLLGPPPDATASQ